MDTVHRSLDIDVVARLTCPRCHRNLTLRGDDVRCAACGTVATLAEGVIRFQGGSGEAYFDERVDELNTTTDNNWTFSYAQQVSLLASYLERATTVLDIGCGSRLPYEPRRDAFVIGVDPSADALRANTRLNLRVHTSAVQLPVASSSIDLLVCFYSLHHMIGRSIRETRANVAECLREVARVLTPSGTLFIVENNPRSLFWLLQRWGWAPAKKILGRHLDMFFWSKGELNQLLVEATGRGVTRTVTCDANPLTMISPLFAMPQFKVFRFMHPLSCSVSIWNKELRSVPKER